MPTAADYLASTTGAEAKRSQFASQLSGAKFERGGVTIGGTFMGMEAYGRMVSTMAQQAGLSQDDIASVLRDQNVGFAISEDGSVHISGPNGAPGQPAAGGAPAPTVSAAAPAGGSASVSSGAGGAGGGAGGGTSSSGGRAVAPGGGWFGSSGGNVNGGSTVTLPGGGSTQFTNPFDPTKPLGLDPSKFPGTPVGGSPQFRSGTFPSAGDPFAGIDKNSSAQDVAMALAKKQYANQQASLGIYGGLYDAQGSDPSLQGARGLAGQLAANPFSLDDVTKSRIAGRSIDQIGQRAGLLQTQAADRAAASGTSRGGGAEDAAYRIQQNAANQAGGVERGLDIEQATRRPGELASALGAVGQFGLNDVGQKVGIGRGAADNVLGQTSILGDALLTGPLLAGGAQPQVKVATPWQGYNLGPTY